MYATAVTVVAIFMTLPGMCTVAQSGMTKSAISSRTPHFFTPSSVIGMTGADELIENPVK